VSRFTKSPPKDPNFPGVSDLRERGWSLTMIEKFLGAPDKTATNPKSRKAAPMKFWLLSRVIEAQNHPDFQAIQAKAARRSAAMTASAAARIDDMLLKVEAMEISVRALPESDLLLTAQKSWEIRHSQGRAERQSIGESDAAFARRISVNYVRHQLTTYDTALDETAEKVGATAARERIRQRVYGSITQCYPYLQKECERQMKHRGVSIQEDNLKKIIKKPLKAPEATTRLGKFASRLLDFD